MPEDNVTLAKVIPIYEEAQVNQAHLYTIQSQNELATDLVDECAIPDYKGRSELGTPKCNDVQLGHIVEQFKDTFCTTPGRTNNAYYIIHTSGSPVRVSPRQIPVQCQVEVTQQIETKVEQGIIACSKCPWMAPSCSVCA